MAGKANRTENRRERRARQVQEAKLRESKQTSTNLPLVDNQELPEHTTRSTILTWCRSLGIASILLGGFGVIQEFFLPSAIVVYLGFMLLLIDLWYENFDGHTWVRWPFTLALIVGMVAFSVAVVFRSDPLGTVAWAKSEEPYRETITVMVSNLTQDDYKDLDLEFRPNSPNVLIEEVKQSTPLSGVTIYQDFPVTMHEKGDSVTQYMDNGKLVSSASTMRRVRCEYLPHTTTLGLVFTISSVEGKPAKLKVSGGYRGRFRTYSYDYTSDITRP